MEFIVLREHTFLDHRGRQMLKQSGDTVFVNRRSTAVALLQQGTIRNIGNLAPEQRGVESSRDLLAPVRVGVFMHTSKFYSGGRVHLYQMAWALANQGAEVFIMTNAHPMWSDDYPKLPGMRIITSGKWRSAPVDLDVILSDGKSEMGQASLLYKEQHPHVKVVFINFETPNWVHEFVPSISHKMAHQKHMFIHADALLCNSAESMVWLKKFMGGEMPDVPLGVVHPAANTFALDGTNPLTPEDRSVPYVVWSARSSTYKGHGTIVDAVWKYDKPLNLVAIGRPPTVPAQTSLHRCIACRDINDKQKMSLMRDAVCVAAPSLFEGFGMVPAESLCNGTPVVAYELPVLRQVYGDRIAQVAWNNAPAFAHMLHRTIASGDRPDSAAVASAKEDYGMDAMQTAVRSIPYINVNRRAVSAQMICYYGPTVLEAIDSVYNHVDEIVIAHGPTELWKNVAPDNSLELIQGHADPDKKIKLEARSVWKNKSEMRSWCTNNTAGNHILIVDADEIYHNVDKWIKNAPSFGCPRWVHFWHDLEHYVVDSPGLNRWGVPHELGGTIHPHLRWAYWRRSNKWFSTRGTVAEDMHGVKLAKYPGFAQAATTVPECCIYHLGHVLSPDWMEAKHRYYTVRDGNDASRKAREHAWHNWDGTTGDCGDGIVQAVTWEIPKLVVDAYHKIKKAESNA